MALRSIIRPNILGHTRMTPDESRPVYPYRMDARRVKVKKEFRPQRHNALQGYCEVIYLSLSRVVKDKTRSRSNSEMVVALTPTVTHRRQNPPLHPPPLEGSGLHLAQCYLCPRSLHPEQDLDPFSRFARRRRVTN